MSEWKREHERLTVARKIDSTKEHIKTQYIELVSTQAQEFDL